MSLVDTLRTEATQLSSRSGQRNAAIDQSVGAVVDHAERIAEAAEWYGDKKVALFKMCEKTLQGLQQAEAQSACVKAALDTFANRVESTFTPKDVYNAFKSAVRERTEAAGAPSFDESYEPLKKVRRIARNAEEGGGAGPSGAGADADVEEDGFAMTQVERSTKCPLLQVEMTEKGELRPMRAPCKHVFSFKGISDYLRGKRGGVACPVMGCGGGNIQLTQLVDDKEMVKLIRRNA